MESTSPRHRDQARALMLRLDEREDAGLDSPAVRVGISGVPGVGKSTFIENLGGRLTAAGHRVGVLAVDPSSVRTGGSVLGDKTRMGALAADPDAFIRPSPAAGTLGGVARATVQSMAVLEAAAYDVVLVETVGVGQSEITVAGMVDTFLFLTLARTGDQLQGIKKGILEIADVVAVNKADGDRAIEAKGAARELAGALRLVRGHDEWAPPVVTVSGLEGTGVEDLWARVLAHRDHLGADGLRGAAGRAAAGLHLGAGARRAGPAAAALRRASGGSATTYAGRCWPASCLPPWPPTACSPPTTGPERRRATRLAYPGRAMTDSSREPDLAAQTEQLARLVGEHEHELVELRRDLHAHPELSWGEVRTSARVAERVEAAGWAVQRLDGSGVVAELGEGERCVGLRADLDALPVHDAGTDPWTSTVSGVAHACGHDVHTTAVVGAAVALGQVARTSGLPGRVRLVFQPAEEVMPGGALRLCGAGHAEGLDRIFALHCDPGVDVGRVGLRLGALTSAADLVRVHLAGARRAHLAPHLTGDLTFALAKLTTELPAILSRRLDPRAGVSVVWGLIQAGSAPNVIPDRGLVAGTVRVLDATVWAQAEGLVRDLVEEIVRPYGVTAELEYTRGVPPVVNEAAAHRILGEVVRAALGRRGQVTAPRASGRRTSAGGSSGCPAPCSGSGPARRAVRPTTCTRAT